MLIKLSQDPKIIDYKIFTNTWAMAKLEILVGVGNHMCQLQSLHVYYKETSSSESLQAKKLGILIPE